MRLIHSADWQLGKPFGRLPPQARAALTEARLDAIDTLASAARAHGAGHVLVAGDVFDSPEPGDRIYRQALARMKAAADVRWLLLPGNHDPLRPDGLWSRLVAEAPKNVTACLEPEPLPLGEEAMLLPAPLTHKFSLSDPTEWFDSAQTPPGVRRVGLAHGAIRSFGEDKPGTLLAPDRARRAGLSYLALGDWHGRLKVDAFTYYSGTPEPDDFDKPPSGLALLVELGGPEPTVRDIPIGRHGWVRENWTLSGIADLPARIEALAPGIERSRLVARLSLSGFVTLAERVEVRRLLEDGLSHEVRWLDLMMDDLKTRPTDGDLAEIDAQGELRTVAERLRTMAADGGAEGRRAAAALERLYMALLRTERETDD